MSLVYESMKLFPPSTLGLSSAILSANFFLKYKDCSLCW